MLVLVAFLCAQLALALTQQCETNNTFVDFRRDGNLVVLVNTRSVQQLLHKSTKWWTTEIVIGNSVPTPGNWTVFPMGKEKDTMESALESALERVRAWFGEWATKMLRSMLALLRTDSWSVESVLLIAKGTLEISVDDNGAFAMNVRDSLGREFAVRCTVPRGRFSVAVLKEHGFDVAFHDRSKLVVSKR